MQGFQLWIHPFLEQMIQDLGVGDPILYDREDFTRTFKRIDCFFDAVGKTSKKQCAPLLKKGGRYLTVAGLDVAWENREQLLDLKKLWETGKLKAPIDRIYPLDRIVEAHRYVDRGRKKGECNHKGAWVKLPDPQIP